MSISSRFRFKEIFSMRNSKPTTRLPLMLRSTIQDGGVLADHFIKENVFGKLSLEHKINIFFNLLAWF